MQIIISISIFQTSHSVFTQARWRWLCPRITRRQTWSSATQRPCPGPGPSGREYSLLDAGYKMTYHNWKPRPDVLSCFITFYLWNPRVIIVSVHLQSPWHYCLIITRWALNTSAGTMELGQQRTARLELSRQQIRDNVNNATSPRQNHIVLWCQSG